MNTIKLNNTIILCRPTDGYVSAKRICLSVNKDFYEWNNLNKVKSFISDLYESQEDKKYKVIIDDDGTDEIWIHPHLAICLGKWISDEYENEILLWLVNLQRQMRGSENPFVRFPEDFDLFSFQ
jgi:hypothetical protein